jgi:hypothetical protein
VTEGREPAGERLGRLLIGAFWAAWVAFVGGLLLGAAAGVKAGFGLFAASGALVIAIGLALAVDYRGVSSELTARYSDGRWPGRAVSTTPFGGVLLIAIGACQIVVGLLSI